MSYWNEERIERQVELKYNMLDRRLIRGELTQSDYDELAHCINAWADSEYLRLVRKTAVVR